MFLLNFISKLWFKINKILEKSIFQVNSEMVHKGHSEPSTQNYLRFLIYSWSPTISTILDRESVCDSWKGSLMNLKMSSCATNQKCLSITVLENSWTKIVKEGFLDGFNIKNYQFSFPILKTSRDYPLALYLSRIEWKALCLVPVAGIDNLLLLMVFQMSIKRARNPKFVISS
jgi:hypothetical protein